mgnify:CR=1 FL=1
MLQFRCYDSEHKTERSCLQKQTSQRLGLLRRLELHHQQRLQRYHHEQIQTADGGIEERPVVTLTCKIGNESAPIQVNLNDRTNLEPFLIGMNLINQFDCKIDPKVNELINKAATNPEVKK